VGWNHVKSLFVETDQAKTGTRMTPEESAALDAELAKFVVPEEEAPAAPPLETRPGQLSGTLDFQALYDQAGIPDTDEVEALEKFLGGLDHELPQASRLAAAKAFLGAIGKAPPQVLEDAERKIRVVRSIEAAKRQENDGQAASVQAQIDELQSQIDKKRAQLEAAKKELEAVKAQCAAEEGRLQAARVFFGAVDAAK
jgi:hypothetical protein